MVAPFGNGAIGWEGGIVSLGFEAELLALDPAAWFKDAESISISSKELA